MSLLKCKDSFVVYDTPGIPRLVAAGQTVEDDDPIVKGREHHFEALEATAKPVRSFLSRGEVASAAPGELRSLIPPAGDAETGEQAQDGDGSGPGSAQDDDEPPADDSGAPSGAAAQGASQHGGIRKAVQTGKRAAAKKAAK